MRTRVDASARCAEVGPRQGDAAMTTSAARAGGTKEHRYYDDYYGEGHEGKDDHEGPGWPRGRG
jgi:hypothetical protein